MRIVVAVCLAVLVASSSLAEDLFTGAFESETRETSGSSTPGEYRLEIAPGGMRHPSITAGNCFENKN